MLDIELCVARHPHPTLPHRGGGLLAVLGVFLAVLLSLRHPRGRAATRQRDPARAGRRRPRRPRRRGRAGDSHAHPEGLARLLAEPRRCRAADGGGMAASAGLRGGAAALPGADPARGRGADELRLRTRLRDPGPARRCRRASPARCRSAPRRAGSPAPTRSACPSRGRSRWSLPSGGIATRDSRFNGWRQALPRPLLSTGRFALEGDRLRIAIPFPRGAALDDPYLFPVTAERGRLPGAAKLQPLGRPAGRRAAAQGRAAQGSSRPCSRWATAAGSS